MDDSSPHSDYLTDLLGFISCVAVCLVVYFVLSSKQEQEECEMLGATITTALLGLC